ncbi:MAG: hypothetical protein EXR27_01080 [Betaproteobacteria bacterium]|nr:hypothetical protein [Betaproteobacteria bacterium]
MAEQLGLRKIIDNTFRTIWWAPENLAAEAAKGYLRALDRAERALQADLPRYLPLWKNSIPPEFADQSWDFSRFTRGERFVYQPFPRAEFDEIFKQVERRAGRLRQGTQLRQAGAPGQRVIGNDRRPLRLARQAQRVRRPPERRL